MPEAGFFAQKQQRPGGLALVILLHAAVIAAEAGRLLGEAGAKV